MSTPPEYRFSTEFFDYETKRQIEITPPPTQYRDVGFFVSWLSDLRERYPLLAQYIIDTAKLIVEASEVGDANLS